MKNIRVVLLGELILFIGIFILNILFANCDASYIAYFINVPSFLLIVLVLIPGLIIMGEWKDFKKAFSIGIKSYSLLELKNIIGAVGAAQKLTIYGALFATIMSVVRVLGTVDNPSVIGRNFAVCCLAGFYALIIEFFLLPLRLNAERKMNEEMDMGDDED
ncbi:MAG: hypothetical protein J5802_13375 [Butyrivibrio sp.]|nr:hypothetical protein [Butyrivibrio sp.]